MDVTLSQLLEGGAFPSVREVSLDEPGALRVVAGAGVASRPVVAVVGNDRLPLVATATTTTLGASFTLKDWLRVGVSAPWHVWSSPNGLRYGRGDVVAFLGVPLSPSFGVHVESSFGGAGAGPWLGAPSTVFAAVGDHDFGAWTVAGDLGLRVQQRVELPGLEWGPRAELGGGVLRPVFTGAAGRHLDLGVEGRASVPFDRGLGAAQLPAELAAVVAVAGPTVRVVGSMGGGLTRGLGAPGLRGGLSIDWLAGPPADRDHDRVWDVADRCDLDAEDRDRHTDRDGCPDLDDDADGVLDVVDQCRLEPETVNDWQDEDGCPDARARVIVRLVGVPEATVRLGPEVVALEQGTPHTWVTNPGWWPVSGAVEDTVFAPEGTSEVLLHVLPPEPLEPPPTLDADPIGFAFDDDHLPTAAADYLDLLASWLRAHPAVLVLRVEGHADGPGASEYNLGLSRRRATAVVGDLVARGVDAGRLEAVGSGEAVDEARSVTFTVLAWDEGGSGDSAPVLSSRFGR